MLRKAILIDTGPLVAYLNRRDSKHEPSKLCMNTLRAPLFTCWPVITEATYLLQADGRPDLSERIVRSCDGSFLEVLELTGADTPGIGDLLVKYRDSGIGFADVSLVHLAEREGLSAVFTLDERDFVIYRTASGKHFDILP